MITEKASEDVESATNRVVDLWRALPVGARLYLRSGAPTLAVLVPAIDRLATAVEMLDAAQRERDAVARRPLVGA